MGIGLKDLIKEIGPMSSDPLVQRLAIRVYNIAIQHAVWEIKISEDVREAEAFVKSLKIDIDAEPAKSNQ